MRRKIRRSTHQRERLQEGSQVGPSTSGQPLQDNTTQAPLSLVIDDNIHPIDDIRGGHDSEIQPRSFPDEDAPSQTTLLRVRRSREKNKVAALQRRTEVIPIRCNGDGQPVCENASMLSTFIGVIARDGSVLPIDVKDWRRMPRDVPNDVWTRVLSRFSFPDQHPRTRRWVVGKVVQCWKEWKYELRTLYFDPDLPREQQYEQRDCDVDLTQWKALVDYWNTDEAKAASARNKRNRAQLTMNHCGGTRSIARLRAIEAAKAPDQREPNRVELFRMTYTHGDGSWVSTEALDKYSQMQQLMDEGTMVEPLSADDAFTRVMGPDSHGRVRGFGIGVTPTQQRNDWSVVKGSGEASEREAEVERQVVELREQHRRDMDELRDGHQRDMDELRESHRRESDATRAQLSSFKEQIQVFQRMFASIQNQMALSTQSPDTEEEIQPPDHS